jgi:hypothetical protein
MKNVAKKTVICTNCNRIFFVDFDKYNYHIKNKFSLNCGYCIKTNNV